MRAQVTLFVIVAILIVSAIGITYYAASSAAKAALNKEQAIIKAVPEKFRPAEINFISCLKSFSIIFNICKIFSVGSISNWPDFFNNFDFNSHSH